MTSPPRERINWDAQPLGQTTDYELARRLGRDPETVREQRVKRGIPAVSRKGTHEKYDWSKQPLGQMSDTDLAYELGVLSETVMRQRHARGIPPFTGRLNTIDRPGETMLVVRIELHNALSGEVSVVGCLAITNDG